MKDSDIDNLLASAVGNIIGDVLKAKASADALKDMAGQRGLGPSGTQLLAMAFKLRHFAKDAINEFGEVEPTLWIIDNEDRQWAMSAEVTNSDDDLDESKAIALLLKRLGAVAYLIVRETTTVRVSTNMTLLEKKAARDNPDNMNHVVAMYGEAVDGSALLMSYLREKPDGKIDVDQAFSSIVGPKSNWPGPHGSSFADHGMKEMLPRPEGQP